MNKKQIKHDMLLTFMLHSRNNKKQRRKPAFVDRLRKIMVMVLP